MSDKVWQLIGTEPFCKEIAGVKVWIKPLTNGQKMKLAKTLTGIKEDASGIDEMMTAVAEHIVRIEGYDTPVAETLIRLSDARSQGDILTAVIGESSLSEDEVKNSSSSSAG